MEILQLCSCHKVVKLTISKAFLYHACCNASHFAGCLVARSLSWDNACLDDGFSKAAGESGAIRFDVQLGNFAVFNQHRETLAPDTAEDS